MLNGANCRRRYSQPYHFTQNIAQKRRILQVRQITTLGLVMGVTDIVACADALTRDHAAA